MLSSGLFPGVCSLSANVLSPSYVAECVRSRQRDWADGYTPGRNIVHSTEYHYTVTNYTLS
jgi:hypothetical protein